MRRTAIRAGRILPALEDRRGFLKKSLALAGGAGAALTAPNARAQGDPAILKLPIHSSALGQPVAARGYGLPSEHETNLQRRESPGLTRVSQASVSFAPLQGMFGIITPSGLHFERHHQGWWRDRNRHRQ